MTGIERTDADWTREGRIALGHEVLDIAPTPPSYGHATAWFAHQLGINPYREGQTLSPLLNRLARHGLLDKRGGVRVCRQGCRADLEWCARNGIDPTHTHLETCSWRLAVDRHDAHELWAELTHARHRRAA